MLRVLCHTIRGLLRRRLQSSFVLLSDYTSLTLTHIVLYQHFFDSQCHPPYDCKLSVMLDLFGVFKVFQPLRAGRCGMVRMYGTIPLRTHYSIISFKYFSRCLSHARASYNTA